MNKRIARRIIQVLKDRTLGNQVGFKATAYTLVNKRLQKALTSETPDLLTIAALLRTLPITHRAPFDEKVQTCINTTLQTEKTELFGKLKEKPKDNDAAKAAHTQDITTRVTNHPLLVFANVTDGHWKGWTPLHGAAYNGHTEIANLLLANGAEMDVTITHGPLEGATPLHWAALRGHTEIIQALLEAGADVNAKDKDDWTPLHGAAACGHKDIVKVLLQAGADPIVTDSNGKTPRQLATNHAIKALLRKASATE